MLSQRIKQEKPSASSLRSAPLKGSGGADQAEELLIGRIRE